MKILKSQATLPKKKFFLASRLASFLVPFARNIEEILQYWRTTMGLAKTKKKFQRVTEP